MRLLPLLLVACRPASDTADKDSGAGSRVYSDADGATLALDADGSLVHTGADGVSRVFHLSLGAVTTPVETTNYDPWYLYDDTLAAAPSDLLFREVISASWDGATFALTLEDDLHATLTVDDAGPGLRFTVAQVEGEPWAPYVRLSVAVDPDEAFYGLGEVFGHVQHRG